MINRKTLILGAVAGVVGLSALGAATFANDISDNAGHRPFAAMMHHDGPRGGFGMFGGQEDQNDPAREALLAGDYAAFVEATKDAPFADKITEEQFATMSARAQQEQAVQTAIKNNDYTAYVAAIQAEYADRSSESFFNDIVAKRATAEAVKVAVEAKDYSAYVTAVQGTDREGKLTEAQFNQMVERKENMMDGQGKSMGKMMENRSENKAPRSSLQAAVMAGDYDAFVQVIAGTALEGKVTQAQFNSVVAKFKK